MWGGDISERVFSQSFREEEDEEALKWASLEKLPTYNRLRKGLLVESKGEANEIDVLKMGFQEKKNLIHRLINAAEEDNEKFLLKLRKRLDSLAYLWVLVSELKRRLNTYVNIMSIPLWLKWYYWVNPVAYTLYGMITSQFGDVQDKLENGETVEEFLRSSFGYRRDFVGVSAAAVVGFTFLFAFVFAFSIKTFNFQKR
ncbi:hypothetical protein RJ641_024228 [Dillenia turbinata]|uniref:Uncharacterized protein n=1 Tax=Dillenia turbinata TaxID=194707 RepID=A0AAN8YTK9_9MAGN